MRLFYAVQESGAGRPDIHPPHFSALLKARGRLIKCFLRLPLRPDDLVQPCLPHEHPTRVGQG